MCLLKSLGQDTRCSILPVSPVQSVSSRGAWSCFPRSLLLFAQGTKNTHHSLASSDGLCPGWEGCNSRHGLDDSITHLLHFVLGLICTLRFLYCNLDFVLFFNPLLNLFTLCVQITLSNIWRKGQFLGQGGSQLGRGPLHLSELQPLLVDLCTRQELALRGLRAGVPLHQPQVPLNHEPNHVRPVHVAEVVALLVQHVNDVLVDFCPNATESHLVLFFFVLSSWVSSVLKAFAWMRQDGLGDSCVGTGPCKMYLPKHLLM